MNTKKMNYPRVPPMSDDAAAAGRRGGAAVNRRRARYGRGVHPAPRVIGRSVPPHGATGHVGSCPSCRNMIYWDNISTHAIWHVPVKHSAVAAKIHIF